MIEDEVTFWGTIDEYEHPLLTLKDLDSIELRIQIRGLEQLREDLVLGSGRPIPGRIINVA